MSKMKYAMEKGGARNLEISWKGNWKEFTVRLNGNEIATIAGYEELKAGHTFPLEDGSSLTVQLVGSSIFPNLRLLRDGQPLPSPGPEPAKRLSMAYKATFLIAGVNLIGGLTGILLPNTLPPLPSMGLWSVAVGCLFLILAFFVMRRSTIALAIAVGIFALDMVFAIIFRQEIPKVALIVSVVLRLFVILVMAQGFGAIQALKQSQTKVETSSITQK